MEDAIAKSPPEVAELDFSDLKVALIQGWRDFLKAPLIGILFGAIFAALGWLMLAQTFYWKSDWSIVPLAAGFPLVGPFVAVGMYEISRLLERGEAVTWRSVLSAIWEERRRQIPSIAFVVLFIFLIWVYMAHLVFALSFGLSPLTNVLSSLDFLKSQEGLTMLMLGSTVGGILAFVLFSTTVVGIPLLVDRDVDVVTAMVTSFSSVLNNMRVMLSWGALVTILLALAILPAFFGLLIVLPVLGHATWHLYKLAVLPEE